MLTMKKTVLAVILAGAGVCGLAHAATLGDAAPASVEVKFDSPSGLTHTLTPMSGLVAGTVAGNTNLASGLITTTDGLAHSMAIIITNGEVETHSNLSVIRIISGTGNPANKLFVYPSRDVEEWEVIDGKTYLMIKGDDAAVSATYNILSWPEIQTIAADTYAIESAAYIYTA